MFGTSIHWTTFFYLLIDTFLLIFAAVQSIRSRHNNLNSYLILAGLFVFYNLTGGFLPFDNFPGPFILQYIITYGVAITMGIYFFHYIYKEYDIRFLNVQLTITNIAIFGISLFPWFISSPLLFYGFLRHCEDMFYGSGGNALHLFSMVILQEDIQS